MTMDPACLAARPRAAFAMRAGLPRELFGDAVLERLARVVEIESDRVVEALDERLADVEVLITGWGCPPVTEEALDAMPRLRGIFHAAGTVKDFLIGDPWRRGIRVTNAAAANAIPVAEYTLAMILLAGKDVIHRDRLYGADAAGYELGARDDIGNFGRTVGIVGASRIGRRVAELLAPFDFEVLVYDPFLGADDPVAELASPVGLDELFERSSIVTVHAPLLPETVGLVGRRQLSRLMPYSTVINTARGPIVDQEALAEVVLTRSIRAVLDVTSPEPLPDGHPLRGLAGVTLTPHLAGALGNELRRLGELAVQEVELLVAGLPARHPVVKAELASMA